MDVEKKHVSFIGYFFSMFLIVMLAIALFRVLSGTNNVLTFTGFLDFLSSSPAITPLPISFFNIVGDWGIFEFLRNFLNLFTSIFGFSIWFSTNIVNVIIYLFYFVRFLIF